MKAIILAAGKGSRLGTITNSIHKSLLNIGRVSIIERQIHLLQHFGISNISIITGYKTNQLKNKLKNFNLNFILNDKFDITDTLYSIWCAKNVMDDDLLILYGDVIFEKQILESILQKSNYDICLVVDKTPCQSEDMKVIVSDSKILQIDKDLSLTKANGKYIGISKYTKVGINILKQELKKFFENNDLEGDIARVLNKIAQDQKCINTIFTNGFRWFNVNHEEILEKARLEFQDSFNKF